MRVTSKLLWVVCLVGMIAMGAQAQAPAAAAPNNELVNMLTSSLHISPQQAQGGAGAIFGLVKSKVSPAEFNKLSQAVPGMDGLLNAAPPAGATPQGASQGAAAQSGAAPNTAQAAGAPQGATGALGGAEQAASSAMGSLGSAAPGGAGGLASLAGSFQSLGLSPTMVTKFAPIMQNYIGTKGGPGAASIFSGALK
jgi:hypothetical protein